MAYAPHPVDIVAPLLLAVRNSIIARVRIIGITTPPQFLTTTFGEPLLVYELRGNSNRQMMCFRFFQHESELAVECIWEAEAHEVSTTFVLVTAEDITAVLEHAWHLAGEAKRAQE